MTDRQAVAEIPSLCSIAHQKICVKTVAPAGQTAIVVKNSFAILAACLVAGVVGVKSQRLVIRLVENNLIISLAEILPRLHEQTGLRVARAVEMLEFAVKFSRVGDFAAFQVKSVAQKTFAGVFVARDLDVGSLALDQTDLNFTSVNSLRRQERPTS